MTAKLFLSGILFVVLITSCSESSEFFADSRALRMVNIWMQTYEGDCGGGENLIFKSGEDMDLTSWRFKNRLEVRADGTISYMIANTMDIHWKGEPIFVTGTWTYDANTETLLIFDAVGEIIYSFQVHAASGDLLVLAYNEIQTNSLPK